MKYKVGHDFKELLPEGWGRYIIAETDGYVILHKDETIYVQGTSLVDLSDLKEALFQIRFSTGRALNNTPLNDNLEFNDNQIYHTVAMPLDDKYLTTWVFRTQKGFEIFMNIMLQIISEAVMELDEKQESKDENAKK